MRGTIQTRGTDPFVDNKIYRLSAIATDVNARPLQEATKLLTIKVGEMDPQFYDLSYSADLPEGAAMGYTYVFLNVIFIRSSKSGNNKVSSFWSAIGWFYLRLNHPETIYLFYVNIFYFLWRLSSCFYTETYIHLL